MKEKQPYQQLEFVKHNTQRQRTHLDPTIGRYEISYDFQSARSNTCLHV